MTIIESPPAAATDPGAAVERATARVLELARTWLAWDGRPRVSDEGDRVYTPHKAIRRYGDHLIDHLAEVEARLAGVSSRPHGWHGSLITLQSDSARFTEADLVEARERLSRLSRTFRLRLLTAGEERWDLPQAGAWTLREVADHVGSPWYAEQLGDLRWQAHRRASRAQGCPQGSL
ncbi:MAG: hypothetical protein ABJA81_10120 [Nocardioidaceae bacterium]